MVFLPEQYRIPDLEDLIDKYDTCVISTLESIASRIAGFRIRADHSIKKKRYQQSLAHEPYQRQEIAIPFLPEGQIRRFSEYMRYIFQPEKIIPITLQLEAVAVRELIEEAIEEGNDLGIALASAKIHYLRGNFSYAQYLALSGWQVGVLSQTNIDPPRLHIFHLGFENEVPVSLSDHGQYGQDINRLIARGGMHECVDRIRRVSDEWNIMIAA